MKNLKKKIILIFTIILMILLVNSKAYAFFPTSEYIEPAKGNGSNHLLSAENVYFGKNVLCAESTQLLWISDIGGKVSYNEKDTITIKGKTATSQGTGKSVTNNANAVMASILQNNRDGYYATFNGDYTYAPYSQSPVQNGVWMYMPTWLKSVGSEFGLGGFSSSGIAYYPSKGQPLIDEGKKYANTINDSGIENKTDKTAISFSYREEGNDTYVKVGPFNFTFGGSIQSVTVRGDDNKEITGVTFGKYVGSTYQNIDAKSITSGQNFYIEVKLEDWLTKIQRIDIKATKPVKEATITFLESASSSQHILLYSHKQGTEETNENFDFDISLFGKIEILKTDSTTGDKLANVGFTLQAKSGPKSGKYVSIEEGKAVYSDEVKTITTDDTGKISITEMFPGKYELIETENANYGYEQLPKVIDSNIEIIPSKTVKIDAKNKRMYIKVSGIVWEDIGSGKQTIPNGIYKENDLDANDKELQNVTVNLKDRAGNIIDSTLTGADGKYQFVNVKIDELQNYYIEFVYNGLSYQCVELTDLMRSNTSKAAEGSARQEFNNKFSVITNNTATSLNGNEIHLSYKDGDHTSTLEYGDNSKYGYEGAKYPINNTNQEFLIDSNTRNVYNGYLDKVKTADQIRQEGIEEITDINLGLYEREQPDLAVEKDINNVQLTVNGYGHTYLYAQRLGKDGAWSEGLFNAGVKFGNKYTGSYTRPIYQADVDYENPNDQSKELKAYITYEIAIGNLGTNLVGQVNSLVDYFDSRYTFVGAGTRIDEKGNVIKDLECSNPENYNEQYQKVTITTNKKVEAQKTETIYVQFELGREAVKNILNDKENLDNVVEINSYSMFDKNGNIYAGIDKTSNPGNCVPGDTLTYQNDTSSAPALKLELADARELTGKVFLDTTSGELKTGEIRQGSGSYEDGEPGIKDVKVTLTETTGSGKVYETTTDENGDFRLSGFIPGDYTLTYTWGDETYTVETYKGTIYDSSRNQTDKEWYKKDVENRLTDAIDDYKTRQEIDSKFTNNLTYGITTKSREELKETKMDSTTPTMGIGVEYETTYTASTGDKYVYAIRNVDFGIVERARQEVEIIKRVKNMKVTLANGQEVVNFEIGEDGKITGQSNHVQYQGPSENAIPRNGFVKLELDSELIQGATIEVTYELKVVNNSELDYLSEKYYKYGIKEGEIVRITTDGIIDYLDKDWAFDQDKNKDWSQKQEGDLESLKGTILSNEVFEKEGTTINDKIILYTEKLKGQELAPKDTATVEINVSKTLSSTDEIELDNETEIVELSKNGGSSFTTTKGESALRSTPGNYIPGAGKTEADDSIAETITITTPTGENLAYIKPIIIGISAFAILAAGVIIIKKKVL